MTITPRRPLRSLLIGDCDHYFSPYIFGVAQACARLGIWHSQVSIRRPAHVIAERVRDVHPDLLWLHMLLWAPEGSPPRADLISIAEGAARRGARGILHDGDVKETCRHPEDISSFVAVALLNHKHDRSSWRVPALHWPYAAFPQDEIAEPSPDWACDLFFAGQFDRSGKDATYGARGRLLAGVESLLKERGLVFKTALPGENTMLRTAEIAASALCVLGHGRPDRPGWVDTRVFQYPGAGAILLHDDAQEFLTPWAHYVPYRAGDAASVVDAVTRARAWTEDHRGALRARAFRFAQERHSYAARVRQVLDFLYNREN